MKCPIQNYEYLFEKVTSLLKEVEKPKFQNLSVCHYFISVIQSKNTVCAFKSNWQLIYNAHTAFLLCWADLLLCVLFIPGKCPNPKL